MRATYVADAAVAAVRVHGTADRSTGLSSTVTVRVARGRVSFSMPRIGCWNW